MKPNAKGQMQNAKNMMVEPGFGLNLALSLQPSALAFKGFRPRRMSRPRAGCEMAKEVVPLKEGNKEGNNGTAKGRFGLNLALSLQHSAFVSLPTFGFGLLVAP